MRANRVFEVVFQQQTIYTYTPTNLKTSVFNIHLCIVDYQKAFDSVEVSVVLKAIESQGV